MICLAFSAEKIEKSGSNNERDKECKRQRRWLRIRHDKIRADSSGYQPLFIYHVAILQLFGEQAAAGC